MFNNAQAYISNIASLATGVSTAYALNIAGKRIKLSQFKQSSTIDVSSELEDMSAMGGLLSALAVKYATSKGPKQKEYASQILFFAELAATYQCITSATCQTKLKQIPIINTLTCNNCQTVCPTCKKNKLGFSVALVVLAHELARLYR